MDALRKAEQEKREAAKRLRKQEEAQSRQQNAETDTSLQLEDIDAGDKADSAASNSPDSDDGSRHDSWQTPSTELELTSLERAQPLSAGTGADTEDHPNTSPVSGDETLVDPDRIDHSTGLDLDVSGQQPASTSAFARSDAELSLEPGNDTKNNESDAMPDDQAFINTNEHLRTDLPISETKKAADDEEVTLNDTLSEENNAGKKRTGSDSLNHEQLDTPATARQVFAARKSASPATLTIIVLVLLIVIGLSASGVFYYYSVTPMVREVASPRVAGQMESRQRAAMEFDTADETPPQVAELPTSDVTVTEAEAVPERSTAASEEGVTITGQIESDSTAGQVDSAEEQHVAESMQTDDSGISTQEPPDAPLEELELSPALLKISRSQSSADVNQTVNEAYAAYRRGDLEQAQTLYQDVLTDNPDERNALLGLGAIAVQQGRFDAAYRYYADILRQNPSDRAAGAALISMQQQSDPASSEARIKRMLADEPDAGYLHQALGNIYAQNQRWPQAQQAYFDAYSYDSDNADYAYNLAVSLDQMDQAKAALEYYVRALELAAEQPISFARQSAQARINQIRQAGDTK